MNDAFFGIFDPMKQKKDREESPRKPMPIQNNPGRRLSKLEYNRMMVYASGNKWAIENFHALND